MRAPHVRVQGSTGIIVSKSVQALVIGLYDNNDVQPGDASKVVEGIGEYLKSLVRLPRQLTDRAVPFRERPAAARRRRARADVRARCPSARPFARATRVRRGRHAAARASPRGLGPPRVFCLYNALPP